MGANITKNIDQIDDISKVIGDVASNLLETHVILKNSDDLKKPLIKVLNEFGTNLLNTDSAFKTELANKMIKVTNYKRKLVANSKLTEECE